MTAIRGVYAAALTPRRLGSQDINLGIMWDVIDFLVDRKVHGIVLLGSTGEFVHFSPAERMRMIGLAPKRSRVPVLVNVSHSMMDGCVEMAQAAQASGAAGVLLMPPYFFRYDTDGLRTFYRRFAQEADLRIPTFLYNIPMFTNKVDVELTVELLASGVVQGVKDSSGVWEDLVRLTDFGKERPFTLMVGNDALYGNAKPLGAQGIISGIATAVPELLLAIDRGDHALQPHVEAILDWHFKLPTPVILKEAAAARGLKMGPHANPLSPEQERTLGQFKEWFGSWLPAVLNACKNA